MEANPHAAATAAMDDVAAWGALDLESRTTSRGLRELTADTIVVHA